LLQHMSQHVHALPLLHNDYAMPGSLFGIHV
jgi:hypothetical protein